MMEITLQTNPAMASPLSFFFVAKCTIPSTMAITAVTILKQVQNSNTDTIPNINDAIASPEVSGF